MKYWIRNEKSSVNLKQYEFTGEPHQSTYIDGNGILHEGYTVEELKREGCVGIYVSVENIKVYLSSGGNFHGK